MIIAHVILVICMIDGIIAYLYLQYYKIRFLIFMIYAYEMFIFFYFTQNAANFVYIIANKMI